MKKPVFILTEIFLSIVLAASAAAAVVLTADIRSGGAILPQSLFTSENKNSANNAQSSHSPVQQSSTVSEASTVKEESSKPAEVSQQSKTEETSKQDSKPEESKSEESKPEESAPTTAETLSLQLTEPKNLNSQPKELTSYIKNYGYDYDTLGFDHMIVVDTGKKSTAKIYCYQKSSKGYWWDIAGSGKALTEKAFIGKEGADFDIKKDSKKTPLGFYAVSEGFYIGKKPKTTFSMFEITDDTYLVTDPSSKYYNQHVEGTKKKDWKSADHLIDNKEANKYGLVVGFNTDSPADKKLASGIFMNIGSEPTEGCIALPETELKAIIEWLDNDSSCYIFIT